MGLFDGLGIISSGKTPTIKDYYSEINAPDVVDLEVQLQQLVQQGVLTPEDAQAALVENSAMEGVSTDPKYKEAQLKALQQLQEIGDGGGMTLSDEANLRKIQSEEQTAARGAREAIINNANARGMGGSGLELMSQLQNSQDAATRASARDTDIAAQAQDRALQAILQSGETAGGLRTQDFNEQATKANSQDAIAKFNAQNQQTTNLANTAARNNAQATNLQNKQEISNANTTQNNQQQMYNKNLLQQDYDNKLKKAGGQSGIASQNAANAGANSQANANANNQLIGGLLGAGAAYLGKGKAGGGLITEGTDGETDNVLTPTAKGEFVIPAHRVADVMTKAHTDKDGNFDAASFIDEMLGYPKKGSKNAG